VSVYLLLRARESESLPLWLLAGLVLGACVLVRTTMLPFALCALGWIALFSVGSRRERIERAGWIMLGFFFVVGAWLERNELVVGRPVLSTEVGYQFWTAHNPETFSRYPAESMDRSRDVSYAALRPAEKEALSGSELERNDLFMRKGFDYVRQNPGEAFF